MVRVRVRVRRGGATLRSSAAAVGICSARLKSPCPATGRAMGRASFSSRASSAACSSRGSGGGAVSARSSASRLPPRPSTASERRTLSG